MSRDLIASRHVIKLLIDPESGRLLDESQAAADFYGLPREELGQAFAWDLTPLGNRVETLRMLADCAAGRELGVPIDARHRRHDGALRDVMVLPDLVEHDGRASILATVIDITGAVAVEVDITARKQAAEALQHSHATLEAALGAISEDPVAARTAEIRALAARIQLANEAAGVGVWEWDLTADQNFWNSRTYALYGLREEGGPLSYADWAALVHPDDLPRVEALIKERLAGPEDGGRVEFRIRRPDGAVRWLAEAGRLQRDKQTGAVHRVYGVSLDITEQKQAEEQVRALNAELEQRVAARTAELEATSAALRASEERFRYAMEATSDGLWDWNAVTGAVYYSPGYARMLGYTQDELAPRLDTWLDLLHPDERADVLVRARHPLGNSGYRELEFRMRTKAGDYRWVLSRGKVVERAADGAPTRVVGTHMDITERKEAELVLRRYRQAVETAGDMLLCIDQDLRFRMVNPAYAAFHHSSPELLEGRRVDEVEDPVIYAEIRPHLEAGLRGEVRRYTVHGIDPSGQERWIEADQRPFVDQGAVVGIVVRLHDLTEARVAQAALEAERALLEKRVAERTSALQSVAGRLQLATQAGEIGIWEMDLLTREITWDEQVRAIYGMQAGQPIPTYEQWLSWLEPEDRRQIEIIGAQIMCGEDSPLFKVVFRVHCPDGTLRVLASQGRCVRDAGGAPRSLLGVNWDITELQRTREAAEQATRAKSEFLAHMSHELRTPMNGVLGLMQVLERTSLDSDQRAMVAQVRTAGRSLLNILDDILDLSRIEAGQLPLDHRPFALVPLLNAVRELFGETARGKGLAFGITAPALDGSLVGDPLRLQQVIVNLIGNAVKFTDRGEVRVDITSLECTAERVRLRFEVVDTGIGMTPQALAGLFRPFTQADASINRRFGGTGLGLSICKRLVDMMGGVIGAESRAGEGSTFWFEVPFARTAEGSVPPAAPQPEAVPSAPRLLGVRLLVVDDSDMNLAVAQRMLVLEGAQVAVVGDGREALGRLRAAPQGFDAVLMDVQMPVMDGLSATRLIRTELGLTGLPVIALTAGVSQSQQETALAAGMNAVLTKPLDLERMVLVLSRWVRPRPEAPAVATGARTEGAHASADAFPEIPGIDRASVAERLCGNHALFLELLEHFARDFAAVVPATRRDLAAVDARTALRRMHTLKGNAGMLGAQDLMQAAAALEGAIERGERGLDDRLQALDAGIGALIAASAPWRGAKIPPPTPPRGAVTALDTGALARFRKALHMHDMGASELFAELGPPLRDALGEADCDALGRAIHDLEFEEALTLLDRAGMS